MKFIKNSTHEKVKTERNAAVAALDALGTSVKSAETIEAKATAVTNLVNMNFESLNELDESIQNAETPEAKAEAIVSFVADLQSQIEAGNETQDDDEATQTLNETFTSLDTLDESVQNAETPEEKTTAVVSLVNTLRKSAGAKPARLKSKTEAPNAEHSEKDENVVNAKKSFSENLEAIEKEYF